MKKAVYITGHQVWFDGEAVDWQGNSLGEIFKANKQKIDLSDTRLILGNDVSFLAAFPGGKLAALTRENVLNETKNHVPLEVGDDCFDWVSVLVNKESWIQSVVVDKDFWEYVSKAVKESGVRISMMIPIAVLLGRRSVWKEGVVMIKWAGVEKLTVLAVRGLVDSVYVDTADDDIVRFAKDKWKFEGIPEVLTLDETNVDLDKEAYGEKGRGDDKEVLNIPVLRNLDLEQKSETMSKAAGGDVEKSLASQFEVEGERLVKKRRWLVILTILGLGVLVVFGWWFGWRSKKSVLVEETTSIPIVPTPSPAVTPAPEVDLSEYSVQVLNGSGEAGLAAGVRDQLIGQGFAVIEVGNAPKGTVGRIRAKQDIPDAVIKEIREQVRDRVTDTVDVLESDNLYDILVILGEKE